MPKDIDDIFKELTKQNKEMASLEHSVSKDLESLSKEISQIHKEQKNIAAKIDTILDILNMLSIFIEDESDVEEEEDEESYYDSNEGWLPEKTAWDLEEEEDEEA